jgi:hypothetical protein
MEIISLTLAGRISANVSEEAFEEVERTTDADTRERRIARLKTFGRLAIPKHRTDERNTSPRPSMGRSFPTRSRVVAATTTIGAIVAS